ncbi:hypothetical protein [Actinoplanes sp. NPDC048796]|uniref:hypothetical protein n=1 Tax=unclassified Actinoplanes TaxID=2626549 RepID=UPI0033D6ED3F
MNTVWRSPFWNTVTAVVFLVMAFTTTASALSGWGTPYNAIDLAIFAPMAAPFWFAFLRCFALGVRADADGVRARLLWRTVTIRWAEIDAIEAAVAPTITWTRSGRTRTTDLRVLGSYGVLDRKRSLGERAAEDLTARLSQWRARNAGT